MKVFGLVLVALAMLIAIPFIGLEIKRYFAPRHAEIDRQVFEQTPSFVHGKAQYLGRLRREYVEATTPAAKAGIRDLILSEADCVDYDLLPFELQTFLRSL